MPKIHLLKPRLDNLASPPQPTQKNPADEKKKKREVKPGEKLVEKDDGGQGSGPQGGQTTGQKIFGRRKEGLKAKAQRSKEGKSERRKEENLAGRRRKLKERGV